MAFQFLGEGLVRLLSLPVAAPVLGLALLAATLAVPAVRRRATHPSSGIAHAGDGLLAHLPLLFVPAGVGVVEYGPELAETAGFLAVALPVSLIVTVAVTGLVLSLMLRRRPVPDPARAAGGGTTARLPDR